MALRNDTGLVVGYINESEAKDGEKTINRALPLTWLAWVTQVEKSGHYYNSLGIETGERHTFSLRTSTFSESQYAEQLWHVPPTVLPRYGLNGRKPLR